MSLTIGLLHRFGVAVKGATSAKLPILPLLSVLDHSSLITLLESIPLVRPLTVSAGERTITTLFRTLGKDFVNSASSNSADGLIPLHSEQNNELAIALRLSSLTAMTQAQIFASHVESVRESDQQVELESFACDDRQLTSDESKLLALAANGQFDELVELLQTVSSDVDLNCSQPFSNGRLTALHFAASYGSALATQNLILAGCDPWKRSKNGALPLHFACSSGDTSTVLCLLKAMNRAQPSQLIDSCQPNQFRTSSWHTSIFGKDSGSNPIHWAANAGHTHLVEILLAWRPELAAMPDEQGRSAIDTAMESARKSRPPSNQNSICVLQSSTMETVKLLEQAKHERYYTLELTRHEVPSIHAIE